MKYMAHIEPCESGLKKSKSEGQTCNFEENTSSSPLKLRQTWERGGGLHRKF